MSNEDKLERIRNLIAKAQGTDNEHEAATFQEAAERLMLKYSVEEWQLSQTRNASASKPVTKDKIFVCPTGHHCEMSLAQLALQLGRHLNVSVIFNHLGLKHNLPGLDVTATAIGFPEDLRMWESIFTILHLQLLGQIDPKVNPKDTFDSNVFRLHAAGIKWPEIARRMNAAAEQAAILTTATLWETVKWPDGGRLKRAARREALSLGEEYVAITSPKGYQRTFASSFVTTVMARFRKARETESNAGTALVLRDKFQVVADLQAELYPDLVSIKDRSNTKFSYDGWRSGHEAGTKADISIDPKFGAEKQGALE